MNNVPTSRHLALLSQENFAKGNRLVSRGKADAL
jgi:hypothetical protein